MAVGSNRSSGIASQETAVVVIGIRPVIKPAITLVVIPWPTNQPPLPTAIQKSPPPLIATRSPRVWERHRGVALATYPSISTPATSYRNAARRSGGYAVRPISTAVTASPYRMAMVANAMTQ